MDFNMVFTRRPEPLLGGQGSLRAINATMINPSARGMKPIPSFRLNTCQNDDLSHDSKKDEIRLILSKF